MTLVATGPVPDQPRYPIIRVRPNANVQSTAGLITSSINQDERVTLRAIGAGAINQAVKAAIQARQYLALNGEDMIVKPGFVTVEGEDGEDLTAVVLHCMLL